MKLNFNNSSNLLASLNPEQKQVAQNLIGPVCVIAGAGTGKTKAITSRIAYAVKSGTYNPDKVIALTFTKKAADEMGRRLAKMGVPQVNTSTFHAEALRQMMHFWKYVTNNAFPTLIPSKTKILTHLFEAVKSKKAGKELKISDQLLHKVEQITGIDELAEIANEIAWCKVQLIPFEKYEELAKKGSRNTIGELSFSDISQIGFLYEKYKAINGLIDFEDPLLIMSYLIANNDLIRTEVHDKYQYFVVDEYQDISPIQQNLLQLWMGDSCNICVVGDPRQTIYTFAGATSEFLNNFEKIFSDSKTISMFRNYRSTPEILDVANKIFKKGVAQELYSEGEDNGFVEFSCYETDREEAISIAKKVKSLLKNKVNPGDIAVLYRVHAQSFLIKDVFDSYKIPCVIKNTPFDGNDLEDSSKGVILTTAHASKGLEWEYVFLTGVYEGSFPYLRANSEKQIEEEKRLFYVAVTRAKKYLSISFSKRKNSNANSNRIRSRFLDKIC